MIKDNPDDPRNPSRRTPGTPEPERSGETSDATSKQPTITEQVRMHYLSERLDRGYGLCRPHRRTRDNLEPLDQLLGPAVNEAEDAESAEPDERSKVAKTASQSSKRKRK